MILVHSSEKSLIFTLALLQFVYILDFMVMMPLGPYFIREFSINASQFSFLISAYSLSSGFMGFLGSFFLDKFERKKIILFLGVLFCSLSLNFYLLVLSRIMTGAFGGVLSAMALALIGDMIPEQRRGRAMGIVLSSFAVVSIVGVPCGLYLANIFSLAAPFYLIGIIGFLAFLLALKTIPLSKQHLMGTASTGSTIVQIIKSKNQLNALAITFTVMLGQYMMVPLISTYLVNNVGVAEHSLIYIYIVGGIASMLISILSGKLSDKFGKFRIFLVFTIWACRKTNLKCA